MSRIGNNPLLKGVSGMLGNVIVFRQLRGRVIMANRPKRPTILTAQQQVMKPRFLKAVNYAKQQMQNPLVKAEYAKGINDRKHSAYAVALTDCMTAPVVHSIDVSKYQGSINDVITIHATDDFKVVSVHVTILNSRGEAIEQGAASLQSGNDDHWVYIITTTNNELSGTKIMARATDKPGNVGSMTIVSGLINDDHEPSQ